MSFFQKAFNAIGDLIKDKVFGKITTLSDQQIIEEIHFIKEDIKTLSPHWTIFFGDKQIARLTQRYKALPTYRLERYPIQDWAIFMAEEQEDLLPKLIEWSRAIETRN
jgi:hypothetical protein